MSQIPQQKKRQEQKKLFGFVMKPFLLLRLLFMMTDDEIETNDCIFTIPMRVQTVNEMTAYKKSSDNNNNAISKLLS